MAVPLVEDLCRYESRRISLRPRADDGHVHTEEQVLTPYEYFGRAEEIEQASAAIYTRLADDFSGEPRVSSTFKELANEESQHAARIRLMRDQYRSTPQLFNRVKRLDEELENIERYVAQLRDEVERGAWGKDLTSVHPRLALMEDRLSLHAERMAREADPRVRGFFEALAQQDHAHRRLFEPGR
jgi:rubrerythrin